MRGRLQEKLVPLDFSPQKFNFSFFQVGKNKDVQPELDTKQTGLLNNIYTVLTQDMATSLIAATGEFSQFNNKLTALLLYV